MSAKPSASGVIPFRPRWRIVTIEYVVIGWDVVLIDRFGQREVLDDRPGVIEDAIQSAIWHARDHGCEFVPGAARAWIEQSLPEGDRA